MNNPATLADMTNDVLSRLAAAANAHIGDLATGVGGAPTISTTVTIAQYLSDEQSYIARYCYPVFGNGTFSDTGSRFVPFSAFTVTGGLLWAVRSVTWNGQPLTYCSRSALELNVGPVGQDIAGTPLYWYPEGDGVGIYPLASSSHSIAAYGLIIPTPYDPTVPAFAQSWLEPDLARVMVFGACLRICEKDAMNEELAERIPLWTKERDDARNLILQRTWASDPGLARAHFPALPAQG